MTHCCAYFVMTFALLIGSADVAIGQEPTTDFANLQSKVKAGDTVYVTDNAGRISRWTIRDTPFEQLIRDAGLSVSDVKDIARQRADSVWNGALIGLAVAATPWLIVCAANDWCYYNEYGAENLLRNTAVTTAAFGAGMGALIDLFDPKADDHLSIGRHGVAEHQRGTGCDRPGNYGAYIRHVLIFRDDLFVPRIYGPT